MNSTTVLRRNCALEASPSHARMASFLHLPAPNSDVSRESPVMGPRWSEKEKMQAQSNDFRNLCSLTAHAD